MQGNLGREQGGAHPLSLAGTRALVEGGQNPMGGEHAAGHVSVGDELIEDLPALGQLQFENDTALIAVGRDVVSRLVAIAIRLLVTALIALWRLNLDHLSPKVSEEHGTVRPC